MNLGMASLCSRPDLRLRRKLAVVISMLTLLGSAAAVAHPGFDTVALARVDESNRVHITIVHDALAFALNDRSDKVPDSEMLRFLSATAAEQQATIDDARGRFLDQFRVIADSQPIDFALLEFPSVDAIQQRWRGTPNPKLPVKMDIVARAVLPFGADSLSIRLPEVFGDAMLSIELPGREAVALPVPAGEFSAVAEMPAQLAEVAERSTTAAGVLSVVQTMGRFAATGLIHIIPLGLDHILFVFALFLLRPQVKPILGQITAFTLAHTLTLTLAALGVVALPERPVEIAIAASVAFVGLENLLAKEVGSTRLAAAFAFGLLHGMGVASAFAGAELPKAQLVTALIGFTAGVELGHVIILVAAFALLGWWRNQDWFRIRITLPLSAGISGVALYWIAIRADLLG